MSNNPIRDTGLSGLELERLMRQSERLRSQESARILRSFGGWIKRVVSLGSAGSSVQPQRHNTTSVIS